MTAPGQHQPAEGHHSTESRPVHYAPEDSSPRPFHLDKGLLLSFAFTVLCVALLVGYLAARKYVRTQMGDLCRDVGASAATRAESILAPFLRAANHPAPPDVDLQLSDPVPPYDAVLTWRNYDEESLPESAIVIWNDVELGQGTEGWREAARRVRALPRGSTILVYPSYDLDWQLAGARNPPDYPWIKTDFWEIVQDRGCRLVFSPRGPDGRIHPQCIPPEDESMPDSAAASGS
jgi:hypothetical protein